MDLRLARFFCGLIGCWGVAATSASAQILTTLASLDAATSGSVPQAPLVRGANGNLYGTTTANGVNGGGGAIFEVTPSGALTTLYGFCGQRGNGNYCTDGDTPSAALTLGADGNFYGTTADGGVADQGVIFYFTPPATPQPVTAHPLYSFCVETNCADGANPTASLLQYSDGSFYGTTANGGYDADPSSGGGVQGTVFRFRPGSANSEGTLTTVYTFCTLQACADGAISNPNVNAITNATPGLVLGGDGNLYAMTPGGGLYDDDSAGTVYRISPSAVAGGTNPWTNLYNFCPQVSCPTGLNPDQSLVKGSDGLLYGTTPYGGAYGAGTIFKISTSGALTTLHNFNSCAQGPCTEGASPTGTLMQATDGNYYGVTAGGGTYNLGTIYKVNSTGVLTTLVSFCGKTDSHTGYCIDGSIPFAGLVEGSDKRLYGTTSAGGLTNDGTVFSLSVFGVQADYLAEGKADYTVWRPSTGYWYSIDGDGHSLSAQWGASSDLPVIGDFDGDGKSDLAVFRPSTGYWYITQTSNGEVIAKQWGASTDTPVSGDFDGDGKTDVAVYRPSTGYWYIVQSSNDEVVSKQWGASTDTPVMGDFDGDGKSDVAVYRPSTGEWYIVQSSNGQVTTKQWGESTDIPVSGDFDGDGKTDIAVYRPSTGYWYIVQSSNGAVVTKQWGAAEDVPVSRDYDGDGKTDIAVFRPSTGYWYVIQSSNGAVVAQQWGASGDVPVNSLTR